MSPITIKNYSLLLLLVTAACGGLSPEGTSGGAGGSGLTGGKVSYEYGDSVSTDDGDFEDGLSIGISSGTGDVPSGSTNYIAPSNEPESIPITMGKCEKAEDDDSVSSSNKAVYKTNPSSTLKTATKNFASNPSRQKGTGSNWVKLRADRDTYEIGTDVLALNLNTGEMAAAAIHGDGSTEDFNIKATKGDVILMAAYDGEDFYNPIAFRIYSNRIEQESDAEQCMVTPESDTRTIFKSAMGDQDFEDFM